MDEEMRKYYFFTRHTLLLLPTRETHADNRVSGTTTTSARGDEILDIFFLFILEFQENFHLDEGLCHLLF